MLGKDVRYKQVTSEELLQIRASGRSPARARSTPGPGTASWSSCSGASSRSHSSCSTAARWRPTIEAGMFAGTNDVIETIGGRSPMSLEAFIEKHRKAFE